GPDEVGRDGKGLYRYADGGRRYLPGQWPKTPVGLFDPKTSTTVLTTLPPADAPPSYPSPAGSRRGPGSPAAARRATRRGGPSWPPVRLVVGETSWSGRAVPAAGKMLLPPPSTMGSIMRRYSSTRSCAIRSRAKLALPITWMSRPSRARRSATASTTPSAG